VYNNILICAMCGRGCVSVDPFRIVRQCVGCGEIFIIEEIPRNEGDRSFHGVGLSRFCDESLAEPLKDM